MKKITSVTIFFAVALLSTNVMAGSWGRSYGSSSSYTVPKSRYQSYNTYKPGTTRNYRNGGQIYLQDGYQRKNGTYVIPHLKTKPDNYKWNNPGYRR